MSCCGVLYRDKYNMTSDKYNMKVIEKGLQKKDIGKMMNFYLNQKNK